MINRFYEFSLQKNKQHLIFCVMQRSVAVCMEVLYFIGNIQDYVSIDSLLVTLGFSLVIKDIYFILSNYDLHIDFQPSHPFLSDLKINRVIEVVLCGLWYGFQLKFHLFYFEIVSIIFTI